MIIWSHEINFVNKEDENFCKVKYVLVNYIQLRITLPQNVFYKKKYGTFSVIPFHVYSVNLLFSFLCNIRL